METDIALLGVEVTDEAMNYHKDGAHWVNLLPLCAVEELVEGGLAAHKSPEEIAFGCWNTPATTPKTSTTALKASGTFTPGPCWERAPGRFARGGTKSPKPRLRGSRAG